MKRIYLVIGALFVLIAGAVTAMIQSSPETQGLVPYDNSQAVAHGKELYAEHCAACHGGDLEGQENWRTPTDEGRAKAPPHDATGHTWHHTDQQNFLVTKYGMSELVGGGYVSDMPGFQDILSDDEILATLAYIKSKWPDRIINQHNQINVDAGQ